MEEYQQKGIAGLKEVHFHKPESELEAHQNTLESYFEIHPPRTIKEARSWIERLTGIHRSITQVREFFLRSGLHRLKVAAIPAKADPDKQEAFRLEKLEPRLEEAKAGKRTVFFVDAAHFVLAPFLGWVWSKVRVFVRLLQGDNASTFWAHFMQSPMSSSPSPTIPTSMPKVFVLFCA